MLFSFFPLICLASSLVFFSCKKEENKSFKDSKENSIAFGKTLFEGQGNCIACHQIEQKVIGPTLREIAKIYKEQNASIVSFLKEDSEPIVDPSKYEIMKTNFSITEEMTSEELQALESYIYSYSK